MRVRHIVVLILLAVNRTAGATGEENELFVTIPVVDTSAAGSPVKSTGTVRFSEDAEKGRVVCSFECEIQSTNISQQPIVLLVIRQEVRCPSGRIVRRLIEYEHLFEPEPLDPGKAEVEPAEHCQGRRTEPALSRADTPSAETTTLYAEFRDGTTFGDKKYALHLRQIRKGALKVLRKLEEAYATYGERQFLEELFRPPDPREIREASAVNDLFIQPLRRVQEEHGTAEAIRAVQQKLSNAEEKLAVVGK